MSEPWVLIVEDDADIGDVVRETLADLGIRAERAIGWRALARAEEGRPALILLDLMLPILDGPQLLHALRHMEATRQIPIVVVTAMGGETEPRVRALGADGYLPKPFGLDELLSMVHTYIPERGDAHGGE